MINDIDFQLESIAWIRSTRGDSFVDNLAEAVQLHGRQATTDDVIHHTMSADELAAYQAAIEFIERTFLAAA